jgi:D-aminopeptidase
VPDIETVAVKEGLKRGAPAGLTAEEARRYNGAAIHLHPQVARERISAGARRALERRTNIPRFWMEPPYELVRTFRRREDGTVPPPTIQRGDDLIAVLTSRPEPLHV